MTDSQVDRSNRYPLTVIILTHNEEQNIAGCLESLHWADDLVIVDSGSSDRTVEKSQSVRPDVRVFCNPFEDFGQQRNWAIDNTSPKHQWILFLDADEQSTADFERGIRAAVENTTDVVGYFLCARNLFLNKWIRYSTFYPSWQLRLFKRGEVRYEKMGHGQREVTKGKVDYVREPYDHFPFHKGIADWVSKHNRYSTHEVPHIQKILQEPLSLRHLCSLDPVTRRRCMKRIAARLLVLRPLLMFTYSYIFRLGFLDGRAGLIFAYLRTSHELQIVAKVYEAKSASHQS